MADTLRSLDASSAREEAAGVEALRLATAYQASRALHVALRLGLPDLLSDGPRSVKDLAHDTSVHAPSLGRLLRALAAYGVFREAPSGRFTLGPLGTALRAGSAGSVRDLALMWGDEDYWVTWGELERCVRTGGLRRTSFSGPRMHSGDMPPMPDSGRCSTRA